MPGCCLGALVLMLGPRVVLFAAWLLSNWYVAFDSTPVAVVGWLFAPWTSLAWIYVHFHHGGSLDGGYVLLLVVAGLVDLGALGSSHRARQQRLAD